MAHGRGCVFSAKPEIAKSLNSKSLNSTPENLKAMASIPKTLQPQSVKPKH